MTPDLLEFEVGAIRFVGKPGLPTWAITHFLETTCLNHLKLITVAQICHLKQIGVSDRAFILAARSVDIFPKERPDISDYNTFHRIANKAESAQEFWDKLFRIERPIVFIDHYPLIDYQSSAAARIVSFAEHSPPEGEIRGAIGGLIDLFYAPEREERARNSHRNAETGQAAGNIERIVRASQTIRDPRTPEGVRHYAENMLVKLLRNQQKLNTRMGISDDGIDIVT